MPRAPKEDTVANLSEAIATKDSSDTAATYRIDRALPVDERAWAARVDCRHEKSDLMSLDDSH